MATASSIPSFATGRGKSNGFLEGFVIDYLANHSEAQNLVRLKEGSQRFLRFDDIERVTEIYCDYKDENGQVLNRAPKRRRDNFKNSMTLSEKKGLLKKVGFGTKSGKEYFKYEIKNDKLWDSLKQKYSVSRKFHKQRQNFDLSHDGPFSDASGLAEEVNGPLDQIVNIVNNEEQLNNSGTQQSSGNLATRHSAASSTIDLETALSATCIDSSYDDSADESFNELAGINRSSVAVTSKDWSSLESLDTAVWLHQAFNNIDVTQLDKHLFDEESCPFHTTSDARLQSRTNLPRLHVDSICETSENSMNYLSELENLPAGMAQSDHSSQENFGLSGANAGKTSSDTGLGNTLSDEQLSSEAITHCIDQLDVDKLEECPGYLEAVRPFELTMTPDFCGREGGCSFNIRGNRNLQSGKYMVVFERYGIRQAVGDGTKYLEGKDTIPEAKRRGTHSINVQVYDEHNEEIGSCNLKYMDQKGDDCIEKLKSKDPKSSERLDPFNKQHQSTKKSSDESAEDAVPNKKSRPIDMAMLMYLSDEMAKIGDKDFFRALIKLGILADVLANRSGYFNSLAVTAQKHGHSELAELIAISSRELSCDCLMEKLTLEKLVDTVQRERSLVISIYDSDDDSDSCLSGYIGDYDSEDDTLSSNADSDDDDPRGIIPQEMETDYEKVELDSPELAENYEIVEVEAEAKDVTKRVASDQNVPMMCAQVESSGVETSSSINVIGGLDNMDTQAVKTAVVETTGLPTSGEHSTNLKIDCVCDHPGTGTPKSAHIQTLYKTDDDLSSNAGNDDNESCNHTMAQGFKMLFKVSGLERIFQCHLQEEESWKKLREEERKRQLQLEEEEGKRQLQFERERKRRQLQLQLAMFGNVNDNVLGRFKSRGCRWKAMLKSCESSCGENMVDFTRKRKITTSSSSLSDLNFKDPIMMEQSFMENTLVFTEKLHLQEKQYRFHNLLNPLTMRIDEKRTVDEKCDVAEIILHNTPSNVLGTRTLVRFSEKQQFEESCTRGQTARHAVEFGNAISNVELEKTFAENLSSSVADLHFTLEAKPLSNETDPGDEVPSTGTQSVTSIALDLARIGDVEVVVTKVEFVSEAVSENHGENIERTNITATASTKNELDEQI